MRNGAGKFCPRYLYLPAKPQFAAYTCGNTGTSREEKGEKTH